VCQHVFATAISIQPQRIQDLEFYRIGHGRAIHILDLLVVLAVYFYLLLIIHPLVRKDISTVHTTNGDDHGSYLNQGKGNLSIFMGPIFMSAIFMDPMVRSFASIKVLREIRNDVVSIQWWSELSTGQSGSSGNCVCSS